MADPMRASAASSSEESAFGKEMLPHVPHLRAFARSLTHDRERADDLVQETIMRGLVAENQFTPGTNLRAWLFTILRNLFYNQGRRKKTVPLESVAWPDQRALVVDPEAERKEEFAHELVQVLPLLALLERHHRDGILAIHCAGMTYADYARACSIEIGTAKSRVSRGLESLRNLIATHSVESFDLSTWASATHGLRKDDPYFPIAEAYERLYASLFEQANVPTIRGSKWSEPEKEIDRLWRELRQSGDLEGDISFEDLIRS